MVSVTKNGNRRFELNYEGKSLELFFSNNAMVKNEELLSNILLLWEHLESKMKCQHLVKYLGLDNFVRMAFSLWDPVATEYFTTYAREYVKDLSRFTVKSNELSYTGLLQEYFGVSEFYNIGSKPYKEKIKAILDLQYYNECKKNIHQHLENKSPFTDLTKRISKNLIIRVCFMEFYDLTVKYFKYHCSCFTNRREIVTYAKLINIVFGVNYVDWCSDTECYKEEIKGMVAEEYKYQHKYFIDTNTTEINMGKDLWRIYFIKGPALYVRNLNFSCIKSSSIRYEVKLFLANRLIEGRNYEDTILSVLTTGFNFLTENNPEIVWCSDIQKSDIRSLVVYLQKDYISKFKRNIGISSVRKIVQGCGLVLDFLIDHAKELNIKSPIPKANVFHDISFYNTRNMEKRTEIIPDIVADEIYSKLQKLNPLHQLMYKIFMDTGLRLKEVTFLEADCISPTEYEDIKYLKYIPFKTLASRRERSLTDHRKMLIPQYLADEIQDQIVKSNSLRDEYNTPYIFINQMKGHRAAVSQGSAFVNAVNRLIKEHNIIDADGQLWRFSSRQFRKTLVSVMIENGATANEIAYWLGHLKKRTASEYYEDIRKI